MSLIECPHIMTTIDELGKRTCDVCHDELEEKNVMKPLTLESLVEMIYSVPPHQRKGCVFAMRQNVHDQMLMPWLREISRVYGATRVSHLLGYEVVIDEASPLDNIIFTRREYLVEPSEQRCVR